MVLVMVESVMFEGLVLVFVVFGFGMELVVVVLCRCIKL